jgi:hypothetical protein
MSRTAVIVSGSLRNLVNASGSWTIHGDYYLIVDQNINLSQSSEVTGNSFDILSENITNCHVNFINVLVSVDSMLPEEFRQNSSANMIAKWKLALHQISALNHLGYDKIIILRPDIYLLKKAPTIELESSGLDNDIIYSTVKITTKNNGTHSIMNDVLLAFNLPTFTRFVNELYWFYLERHKTMTETGHDIHSIMAEFAKERKFEVNDLLNKFFEFTILRDNSVDMFDNGILKAEYSFKELVQRSETWWKQRYG